MKILDAFLVSLYIVLTTLPFPLAFFFFFFLLPGVSILFDSQSFPSSLCQHQ